MKKIKTSEIVDHKPKDVFIADTFREEIMSGRLKKGDKLLSDEKIALKYKINKRTVASGLNSLVKEGLLSRAPRRGTIVIRDIADINTNTTDSQTSEGKTNTPENEVSSVYGMDHLFFIAETKTLKFVSFENHPKLHAMWKHLIDEFNSKSKRRQIELEIVHIDVLKSDKAELRKYWVSKGIVPDIIQCLLFNVSPNDLAELPNDLIDYTTGEDSLIDNVRPDFQDLMKKMVPVYTSIPVCVWNQEMAEEAGIKSLKENILEGKLIETLSNHFYDLPDNLKKVGPHLSSLLRYHGLPASCDEVDIEYFNGFFAEIFKGMESLKKSDRSKLFIGDHNYNSYENFSRKKHFLLQTLSNPYHYPDHEYLDFKLGSAFFPPKQNINMELSSLGISRESKEPEFAADFLRFVASRENQMLINRYIKAIPYRKSAMEALPEVDPQFTKPEIDLIREKTRFALYSWENTFIFDVIFRTMVSLFEKIENGKINSSYIAAETACRIFNKQLKKNNSIPEINIRSHKVC